MNAHLDRLQRLAAEGDKLALQALIREAQRANNVALLPLELLRLGSKEAFEIGCEFPISAYPQHLQGIAVPLACVLYRWQAGFKTVTLKGSRGTTERTKARATHIWVSTTRTEQNGTAAGGFRLRVWEHTPTNIQIELCVNNQSCKQAKTAYAAASKEDAIESIIDFYKKFAFIRGVLPAQYRRGFGSAFYTRLPDHIAKQNACEQWAGRI